MRPPDEGWMGVVLEGNLKHRRFRGIKSKSRQEALREKREEGRAAAKQRAEQRAQQRAAQKVKADEAKAAAEEAKAGDEEGGTTGEVEPEESEEAAAGIDPGERTIPPEVGVIIEEALPDEQPPDEQPPEEQPTEEPPTEEPVGEEEGEAQQYPQ
jgi:hypothetical protein